MHHHRLGPLLGIALALQCASGPSVAVKLYKWVDEQGNVTYSQLPPPEQNATSMQLRGIQGVTNSDAEAQLEGLRERADEARKNREFKSNYTTETQARDDRLKENCEVARQNVRVLETASRVKTDDGSFLDPGTQAARLATAREQVEEFCN